MQGRDRKENSFTLIELLVVIAIISVLAAMLLPALQGAREMSRRASCAGNLRQMAMAIMHYSNDWDGFLPTTFSYCSCVTSCADR